MFSSRVNAALLVSIFAAIAVMLILSEGESQRLAAQQGRDKFGSLLPNHAIQRFGTTKFRHGSRILALAYSPDGKILASGGGNDPIRFWSSPTGEPGKVFPEQWTNALAFSPNGIYLAAGGAFKTIRVWNQQTGAEYAQFKGHNGAVKALAFSPNGRYLVSAGADKTIRIWDMQTRGAVRQIPAHEYEITCLSISPDGKTIASGSLDYTVRFWDLNTGQAKTKCACSAGVNALQYVKGRKLVAAGQDNGWISLWDAATGKRIRQWQAHKDAVTSLLTDKKGETLVSTGYDGSVALWNYNTAKNIKGVKHRLGDCDVTALSPDGKTLACAGRNNTIRFWDIATGKDKFVARGPEGNITDMVRSPDGKWLAVADSAHMVRLLDADTFEAKHQASVFGDNAIKLAFSGDSKQLAAIVGDSILLWDVATKKVRKTSITLPRGDRGMSLDFSPTNDLICIACYNSGVHMWNLRTEKHIRVIPKPYLHDLAFSPNGKILATAGLDGVTLWHTSDGQQFRRLTDKHPAASVAFTPDGTTVASGHFDSMIRLWDLKTGNEVRTFEGHHSPVFSVAFSSSGRLLASGSFDKTARIWEVASGSELAKWAGHIGSVQQVALSANDRRVFSGSADTTLLAWDSTLQSPGGKLPSVNLTQGQKEGHWTGLASTDGQVGYRAVWGLLSGGEQALDFLQKRVYLPDRVEIEKLIARLNSNRFAVREKATIKLSGYGQWIRGRLEEAAKTPPSLEVKLRLDNLLAKLNAKGAITIQQERLRLKRVMQVLEQSGSKRARDLLEHMVRGAVETAISEEAQQSLDRISKRQSAN